MTEINIAFRAKAEQWVQENVHPASDQERTWAVLAFEAGMRMKSRLTEEEQWRAFDNGFYAYKYWRQSHDGHEIIGEDQPPHRVKEQFK